PCRGFEDPWEDALLPSLFDQNFGCPSGLPPTRVSTILVRISIVFLPTSPPSAVGPLAYWLRGSGCSLGNVLGLGCAPMSDHAERHDWTLPEVRGIHDLPLLELLFRAQSVHRTHFAASEVQLCSLLSVKTGGCPEDCAYCPQAARYKTG